MALSKNRTAETQAAKDLENLEQVKERAASTDDPADRQIADQLEKVGKAPGVNDQRRFQGS